VSKVVTTKAKNVSMLDHQELKHRASSSAEAMEDRQSVEHGVKSIAPFILRYLRTNGLSDPGEACPGARQG
jgi:hypothetical protein